MNKDDKILEHAGALLVELLTRPGVIEAIAPLLTAIGSRIADATAKRIIETQADALVKPTDAAIPIKDLCRLCGVSVPTFVKHFIATGKLKIVPAPPRADRRQRYVLASEWNKISKAATMRVIHPKAA